MLGDLDAGPEISQAASRLRQGEIVVRWPGTDEAHLVRVDVPPQIDTTRTVLEPVLAEHMRASRQHVTDQLPYRLCTAAVCASGCLSAVRRRGQRLGETLADDTRTTWRDAPSVGQDPFPPIFQNLLEHAGGDTQTAYCGAVHLSINGAAFSPRPGHDDRQHLVEALDRAVRNEP